MYSKEFQSTFYISLIYSFRMIGLFIIFPIFSLYVDHLKDATPFLISLALGIYGLTQASLQLVLGIASDYIGRKKIILFGLLLFILGSIIAACSTNIYGIIIGRALQGAGAIGSTLTALIADITKEENRLKAMSIIGMSIGLSFMVAMMISPILNSIMGLSGIFWVTAIMGVVGVIMLFKIPTPRVPSFHHEAKPVFHLIKSVIFHKELLRLNFGIFALHAILTALFIVVPIILTKRIEIAPDYQWLFYLPVLVISFGLVFPFIIIGEVRRKIRSLFIVAIITLTLCILGILFEFQHVVIMGMLLTLFFASFSFLEATLPSIISKTAPVGTKGTAMGIFSSAQFFGIFIGGSLGGVVFELYNIAGVLIFCTIFGILWFIVSLTMGDIQYLNSKIYHINLSNEQKDALENILSKEIGIYESNINLDEEAIYIKFDKKEFSEASFLAKLNTI